MKRSFSFGDFALCFGLNLLFQWEYLALALVFFALNRFLRLPVGFALISLALWILLSLGITCVLSWSAGCSPRTNRQIKNANPYSSHNYPGVAAPAAGPLQEN